MYNNTLGNGTPPPISQEEEDEDENNNERRMPPHVYSDAVVSAPLITWFGLPTLIELEQRNNCYQKITSSRSTRTSLQPGCKAGIELAAAAYPPPTLVVVVAIVVM
jgi:hypothetical protein